MTPLSELEQQIFTELEQSSQRAMNEGWALTKQAFGAVDPDEQNKLTAEAETAYKSSMDFVDQVFKTGQPSEELTHALKTEIVKTDINVFDLYRRVGRLEEARNLGEETLENAMLLGETALTHRAGNFLTLVQAAEAYEHLDHGRIQDALAKYREREATFNQIGPEKAEGKNAVMLYLNQAANYLDIVDLSVELEVSADQLEKELTAAAHSVEKAQPFIAGLEPQDKANWQANAHYDLGTIAGYRGDLAIAVSEYQQAFEISKQGADYNLQTAFIELSLVHALAKAAQEYLQEDLSSFSVSIGSSLSCTYFNEARAHLQPVETYMQDKGFGIYQRKAELLLAETKKLLPE